MGSRVTERLFDLGYKVSIVDKVEPKERGIIFSKKIKATIGDLRDSKVADKSLKDIDLVVHLAANIGSLTYMRDHQAEILQENSAIDATLYPAMVKAKIKCVVYSSSSMVFQKSSVYPYRESDIDKVNFPTNVYGMSKLVGEYFCKSYKEQYGLNYVIMRYHNIYGEGEDSKGSTPGDIHVIPALVEKVLKGQYPLELLGNPDATRPFTYIDDAVYATVRLVEGVMRGDRKVINEDFNIGPADATKIIDLAKLIWKVSGDKRSFKFKSVETTAITADRREMNPEKLTASTHWKPKVSLEEGILVVFKWLNERSPGI
ncbi:MAG: NAD-dependent epimerase/dehydratase [Candidatus Woesebacteria bacterium GW2011_GWB1_38_5b]|uniref:NAD-dependent epimerase/dehydratase n=1 Tax=Candidatus Woesebacteria bacterium GW2011_GWB1_38_5b TaxID=1618569 RepID=A0A0G0NB19_9BACT|nr:MAG: NAD-dependent epimerase/dehydratase [Candidatus Woesebacteria bacterium GW2011_GWB1_38_5b]